MKGKTGDADTTTHLARSLRSLARTDNPTLSEKDRSHLLSTLAPSSSSPILTNLLTVLISNSRLPTLPSILTDFQTLLSAHKNILPVTITTAEPLKEGGAEWKRLEKALRGTNLARGKELRIVNRVNAGVVGGLMVDFGEQTIDLTAGSKVNKFNAALAGELHIYLAFLPRLCH